MRTSQVTSRGLAQLGGISFVASGVLFLANGALQLLMGPPPSAGPDILKWMADHAIPLAFTPEILFFAAVLMVPAVIALYDALARTHPRHAASGVGVMAVAIPVLFTAVVVAGRLVYPTYGIKVHTPEIAEFAAGLFYGGLHAVALLLAGATFVVSLAMRGHASGGGVAYLGFASAVFELMTAYPEAIGPALTFISGAVFAGWLLALGVKLYRTPAAVPSETDLGRSR